MKNKLKVLNGLGANYFKLPTKIFSAGLSYQATVVYCYLASGREDFNPGVRFMAQTLGMNKTTVCRALKELLNKRIIVIATPSSRGVNTRYAFNGVESWYVSSKSEILLGS